jgi:endoglucanase
MSEPTVSPPPKAPPKLARGKKARGKKILGLPMPVALGLGAGVVALAWLWYRSREKKTTTGTTTSASSSTGTLTNGQLDEIQDELAELLSQEGQGSSTGTGTGTGVSVPPNTPPPTPASPAKPTRAPSGVHTTDITKTTATVAWGKISSATSYRVQVHAGGDIIHDSTASGTQAALSGLKAGHTYNWHVAAVNSAGQGPWSGPVTFKTLDITGGGKTSTGTGSKPTNG